MISFCVPSRQRPEQFKQMCQSALDTADHPEDIEFVRFRDDDDTVPYEYIGNWKEVHGPREWWCRNVNECAKVATGPIYFAFADNNVIETKGWDDRVKETFEAYPDKIVWVCPDNDDWKIWRIGTFGFVHKNWIDTVGYFLPPYHGGQGGDLWNTDVGRALNRMVRLRSMYERHYRVLDAAQAEKRARARKEKWWAAYRTDEMKKQRAEDIAKLQKFITDFRRQDHR